MTTQDFTTTLLLDATPDQVFAAINQVRGWWSEQLVAPAARLGAEFELRYKDLHESTHRITELVPGKKIVWETVKAAINFVSDKSEWNGTTVVFELHERGEQTELVFTHVG